MHPHLRRIARRGRSALADLRRPPWVPAGHYYSPRTSVTDVERAVRSRRPPVGVDMREQQQLALARQLDLAKPVPSRWQPNPMFGALDAGVLRAMLLHLRPAHFFEVGSGHSTAVALDVADEALGELRVTCVEPYPARLLLLLRPGDQDRLTLLPRPAQQLVPEEVAQQVRPGDVLFIDSTHVVKAGSDVVWLLLHTLPLLDPGVVVHVHDIHWPFEYPDAWLREGRDWTEAYLLHAFLAHNRDWEVLFFNDWLSQEHPEALPDDLRGVHGGSIWLRRTG